MSRFSLSWVPLLLLYGCNASESSRVGSAGFATLVDSVVLVEADSVFVGEPSGFAMAGDGAFVVADRRNGTVHRFARDGRRLSAYGRRGPGPTEWQMGPFLTFSDSGHLGVSDGPVVRILKYPSGEVEGEFVRAQGAGLVGLHSGTAYFRRIDPDRRTLFEAISDNRDSSSAGRFTMQMGRSQIVDGYFSAVALTPISGGSVAYMVQNDDHIFVTDNLGAVRDSVSVPVVRRRGAVPELLSLIRDEDPRTAERASYQPTFPLVASTLSRGRVAFVGVDQKFMGNRMTGQLYLTVAAATSSQIAVCVDYALPGPTDPLPWAAFSGDTLFQLIQDVDSADRPRTIVRHFIIDTSLC